MPKKKLSKAKAQMRRTKKAAKKKSKAHMRKKARTAKKSKAPMRNKPASKSKAAKPKSTRAKSTNRKATKNKTKPDETTSHDKTIAVVSMSFIGRHRPDITDAELELALDHVATLVGTLDQVFMEGTPSNVEIVAELKSKRLSWKRTRTVRIETR